MSPYRFGVVVARAFDLDRGGLWLSIQLPHGEIAVISSDDAFPLGAILKLYKLGRSWLFAGVGCDRRPVCAEAA